MNRKLFSIVNYFHVKPLCDVKSERSVPGQGGLGLCDVVRLVVQVVAQEMYLEKYKDLRKTRFRAIQT